jgi:hypothetical protein
LSVFFFFVPRGQKLFEFKPPGEGGDIPFHRVIYFRDGNKVLWDRERRIDNVFKSGGGDAGDRLSASQVDFFDTRNAAAVDNAEKMRAEAAEMQLAKARGKNASRYGFAQGAHNGASRSDLLVPIDSFRFDAEQDDWVIHLPSPTVDGPQIASAESPESTLRVATWNVLNGSLKNKCSVRDRTPLLLAELELVSASADIVALQEVTRSFATDLIAQQWARSWYISAHPVIDTESADGAAHILHPAGVFLMSRYPINE